MQELINKLEEDIRQALDDYGKHSCMTDVLDDVSEGFIRKMAYDAAYSKQALRDLFRKSPVWDENLQALVINGTRTHDPDPDLIRNLGVDILRKAAEDEQITWEEINMILTFFETPNEDDAILVDVINRVAPKAYAPGKKRSRIFKAICKQLGLADETAGSDFQRLYAQFADELTARRIGFKLFVSIHPAHFITMSNPKGDKRGTMLTSCHSFNSTEYQYNNGCSGYARDRTSFIAFTVDDPNDPELFNNRKTTRQVYAYKPGNGVLLQSRFYNTSGGTHGAQEDSQLYRDLIEREISMLENQPNLWKLYDSHCGDGWYLVETGEGFGGYCDWEYSDFAGKVAVRNDCAETRSPLVVGTYGRCCACGCETSAGVYCEDCEPSSGYGCDDCGEYVNETHYVHDEDGHERYVCDYCRDHHYTCCDECGEYYPNDAIITDYDGNEYCPSCADDHLLRCGDCGNYFYEDSDDIPKEVNGTTQRICAHCRGDRYRECDLCCDIWHIDFMWDGGNDVVCPRCRERHYPESLNEEESA